MNRTAAISQSIEQKLEMLDRINLAEKPQITTVQRVIFTMFNDVEPKMLQYRS